MERRFLQQTYKKDPELLRQADEEIRHLLATGQAFVSPEDDPLAHLEDETDGEPDVATPDPKPETD